MAENLNRTTGIQTGQTATSQVAQAAAEQEGAEAPASSQPASPQGASVLSPLPQGSKVGGYILKGVLGKGAFGVTYLAQDATLNSLVAVKEYFPQQFAIRDADLGIRPAAEDTRPYFEMGRKAFLEEARTLARFKHPHIVRILAFFEANNTAYFAMEYERGQSLKALLKDRGTLRPNEVTDILSPLMEGLERLHDQDVLHRDIKPGNIYLRQNGEPVLLDFGAALQRMSDGGGLQAVVTEGYSPPEQYTESQDAQGPWTDMYALAAVALRCLTGTLPASAPSRRKAIASGGADPVQVQVSDLTESLPISIVAVIRQGLALDPEQRLRNVHDWKELYAEGLAQEADTPPAHVEEGASAPLRILLVSALTEHGQEDTQRIRRCDAVETVVVPSGEAALQHLRTNTPDGCLVDFLLEDMTGLEFLRQRRSNIALGGAPICLAGDGLSQEQILEATSLGACAVLTRPYSVEQMRQALDNMRSLRQSHQAEQAMVSAARQALALNDGDAALGHLREWSPLAVLPSSKNDQCVLAEPKNGQKGDAAFVPLPVPIRGPALVLFSQACRAMVQGRLTEAGLALAMSRKICTIEAEARMAMADASRMAGKLDAFAACAHDAHQAYQLLERMDIVSATLGEVLAFEDHRPLPLNTVGVQLRRQQALPEAELALSLALEISPFDPRIHYNVAKALAYGGKHKEAFAEVQRALKLDPDFEEAESLYRKITGKAWRAGGKVRTTRPPSSIYQPLLDM